MSIYPYSTQKSLLNLFTCTWTDAERCLKTKSKFNKTCDIVTMILTLHFILLFPWMYIQMRWRLENMTWDEIIHWLLQQFNLNSQLIYLFGCSPHTVCLVTIYFVFYHGSLFQHLIRKWEKCGGESLVSNYLGLINT